MAVPENSDSAEKEALKYFEQVLKCCPDVYYKVLALERLGYCGAELEQAMFTGKKAENLAYDEEAQKLLLGFADFGFPQKIYPAWERFYYEKIPLKQECLQQISEYIGKCGDQIPDNLYKSLRIASIASNASEIQLTGELLKLAYPQNYSEEVENSCREFNVSEKVLFALIRSESFFKKDIKSNAGAIGLTQLMETTGADIARRLKVKEFDLNDPSVNIRFGTWYLNNLTERLDSSVMLAVFAYNSGITRVRRWVSTSKKEFGKESLPMDLFLETIPFDETREYGRKIVAAAAMYGWLYYGVSPVQTVKELFEMK